ncbi:hypothetical protein [Streptomyces sp. NPDC054786]
MSLSGIGKTAGQARDATHKALGGKNASGLEHKVITAKGIGKVEVQAPDGFIVTGGGWYYRQLLEVEGIKASYPSDDGKTWTVRGRGAGLRAAGELAHLAHKIANSVEQVTAYCRHTGSPM